MLGTEGIKTSKTESLLPTSLGGRVRADRISAREGEENISRDAHRRSGDTGKGTEGSSGEASAKPQRCDKTDK